MHIKILDACARICSVAFILPCGLQISSNASLVLLARIVYIQQSSHFSRLRQLLITRGRSSFASIGRDVHCAPMCAALVRAESPSILCSFLQPSTTCSPSTLDSRISVFVDLQSNITNVNGRYGYTKLVSNALRQ
jgi:hypothetical protein